MFGFGDSKKTDSDRVPLDGTQRARLVNMRLSRVIGYEPPQDLLSKVLQNPGRLTDGRRAVQSGVQRWFKRGMDDYAPRSLTPFDDDYQYWDDNGERKLRVNR